MRPQRGSWVTSIIGENVQRTPFERVSAADTSASLRATSGSKDAAWASGIGNVVQKPWMTSRPNSSGMPSRDSSTAIRCSALVCAAPWMLSTEPSRPARAAASMCAVWPPPGPVSPVQVSCCS